MRSAWLALVAAFHFSSTALAYEQHLSARGIPAQWPGEIVMTVDLDVLEHVGPEGMRAIRAAAAAWAGIDRVPLIRIAGVTPASERDTNLRIRWSTKWSEDAPDEDEDALATTEYGQWANGERTFASILINGEAEWHFGKAAPDDDHYDFQSTMTHEFGHVLGLGHSDDLNAAMRYDICKGETLRMLGADDIEGITDSYSYGIQWRERQGPKLMFCSVGNVGERIKCSVLSMITTGLILLSLFRRALNHR